MSQKITPVLMSGGSGTRLWPVSRTARPKQFHALGSPRTLIQETALRVSGEMFGPPVVVCAAGHADVARAQLVEAGITPKLLILEPVARNTAACAVAAAAQALSEDPQAMLLLLPADNHVLDLPAFRAAVEAGRAAALEGKLVVFGLKPTRPETGYGYIQAATASGAIRPVAQFREKPDQATAEVFVADPAFSWNAGMFLFRADAFLAEARRLAPEVAAKAEAAVFEATRTGDVLPLGPSFAEAPSISIDYAVMEKTADAMVAPVDMGWSDVGAWRAIWELSNPDAAGNAFSGDVVAAESTGSFVRTDGPTVVLAGVSDLVVVVENGVVLVAARDDSAAVKSAVEALKALGRQELL